MPAGNGRHDVVEHTHICQHRMVKRPMGFDVGNSCAVRARNAIQRANLIMNEINERLPSDIHCAPTEALSQRMLSPTAP